MRREYKIISYDLAASFDAGSKGIEAHRVINTHGRKVLSETIWSSAFLAFGQLRESLVAVADAGEVVGGAAVADAFEEFAGETNRFLCEIFLPDFLESVEAGHITFHPLPLSAEKFSAMWAEYDVVERVDAFLRFVESYPQAMVEVSEFAQTIKRMAAIGILARIDDAVIAAFFDDVEGAMNCGEEIERFRAALEAPEKIKTSIDVAVKTALSDRARSGGRAKNKQSNLARDFVAREWASHRSAYDGNKSEFARHYAGRVKNEFDVTITVKTISEVWLSDSPAAS
jgi:hypothetical protein